MSVKDALRFIERLDEDVALQCSVREASSAADLDAVVRVAVAAGFEFTPDDLRRAFRGDWQMRRRFFSDPRRGGEAP